MPTLDERIEAVRQGRGERNDPILLILDLAAERERLLQIIADRCPMCRGTGIKGSSGGTGDAKTVLWKCDHGLQWAALASEPRA